MSAQELITQHLDIWTAAHKTRSGVGRGSNNKLDLVGIKKLRELILELAVRGKLVPQNESDEPASELLRKIAAEKAKLIKEGKIKKEKPLPEITDEEKPFELPAGWKWVRLNEIGYTQTGGTPSKSNPNFYGNDVPFIKPGDIYSNYVDYENEGLSFEGAENLNRIAPKCSILMVCIGTIGKRGLINRECAFNQQINSITPFIEIEQFLYRAMGANFFQQEAWNRSSSTTIAILNKGNWETILIPVPPLPEQHRIVAKVDELMAFCDQLEQTQSDNITAHAQLVDALLATLTQSPIRGELVEPHPSTSSGQTEFAENWQRIAAHFDTLFTTEHSIDQLKQTILQLAVMGKLVPQDPNDEPASELLKKIAAEKAQLIKEGKIKKEKTLPEITDEEKPFELPRGWEFVRKNQVLNFLNGYAFKSEWFQNDGVRLLRNVNVSHGATNWGDVAYISDAMANEFNGFSLNEGDIVLTLDRPIISTGLKCAVIQKEDLPCLLLQRVARLSSYADSVSDRFLLLWLNSNYFIDALDPGRSNGVPHISTTQVGNMVIPLPSLNEQHRIVAKVDELITLCDTLKVNLQNAQTTQLALADALVEQAVN